MWFRATARRIYTQQRRRAAQQRSDAKAAAKAEAEALRKGAEEARSQQRAATLQGLVRTVRAHVAAALGTGSRLCQELLMELDSSATSVDALLEFCDKHAEWAPRGLLGDVSLAEARGTAQLLGAMPLFAALGTEALAALAARLALRHFGQYYDFRGNTMWDAGRHKEKE